jgi:GntR family transcriptional repressor for pyruvate dehydrogenase complex
MDDKFDLIPRSQFARAPTLSKRVTEAVEELIIDNELSPGDRLPSERMLAEKFDVSRTVIREAVQALVAKGLLEVRRGSGTVVCRPATASVSKSMSLLLQVGGSNESYDKVHEVRTMLEVRIAELAAERRTDTDLMRLERALDRMISDDHDRTSFSSADVAFHSALAIAARNDLLVVLHDSIADVMLAVRQRAFDTEGSVLRAHSHHRRVFEAVRAGDPVAAARSMAEHLDDSLYLMEHATVTAPKRPPGRRRDASVGAEAEPGRRTRRTARG